MPKKKRKSPLRWKAGVKHPTSKKAVGGRVMTVAERSVYKTDGKLRKGKKKADLAEAKRKVATKRPTRKPARRKPAKRRRNAAAKTSTKKKGVSASSIKITQTRKTAPGGWKSSMGPYVICTAKGNAIKGGSFRSLDAAKKKLAALRNKGRKGLKLVKVAIPKKAAKKASTRRKTTTRRRKTTTRRKTKKRKTKKRKRNAKKTTVSKAALKKMMKRLGL
jgi:hypothetical protein